MVSSKVIVSVNDTDFEGNYDQECDCRDGSDDSAAAAYHALHQGEYWFKPSSACLDLTMMTKITITFTTPSPVQCFLQLVATILTYLSCRYGNVPAFSKLVKTTIS